MSQDSVLVKVTSLAESLAASLGLELVDVEYQRAGRTMVLRLFIDKDGGVTLDDCADFSHEFSQLLDVEDFIREHYTLEVSSPGLDRPIKREQDYVRYSGRLVKLRTFELLPDSAGNKRKTFLGTLIGIENGIVRIQLKEGQLADIPLNIIAKANLEFEF
ncbi:ribosome maturation factor RimP [Geobacter sp. OR-1]|uniref:ribosome maturation factor RimP n=1 Tax=Geobacter sp. OR-1 TaxID=1266765 RepID=UPI0005428CD2|nr:ribosome maturation factor RimP [Geobacter sp. OR-1]GAM09973.1 ribosome maturation factor RimP [Geobacter sp. OR-1]